MAKWTVGASRNLPVATDETWDGGAAAGSIFEWAGGDSFDCAKARRGFLVYDSDQPDERGSYKLPFAIVSDGTLKASPAGIRAAASRLPQTDIPDDVKTKAQAVIDHYEDRMGIGDHDHDGDSDTDDKAAPAWRKACESHVKAVSPDATQTALDAINTKYALQPLAPEDVFLGQMHLANTQYDRSDERFPKSYLDRFAQTLPGKSVMTSHDYGQVPVGRFYDAEVRKDAQNGGHYLHAKFYLAANGPVTDSVRMGIAKDASIGFQPDKRMCDICGKDYDGYYKSYSDAPQADDDPCMHIKGRMYGGQKATVTYGGDLNNVEAQEGSLVWLGCQRGAMTTRGAAADARKAAHCHSLATAGSKEEMMDEKAAKAREDELKAEIERLKALAADGQKYRDWQKAEIARLYSSLGEEKAGAAMVAALKDADAGTLDGVRQEIDKRHAEAFARSGAETGRAEKAEPARITMGEFLYGRPTILNSGGR